MTTDLSWQNARPGSERLGAEEAQRPPRPSRWLEIPSLTLLITVGLPLCPSAPPVFPPSPSCGCSGCSNLGVPLCFQEASGRGGEMGEPTSEWKSVRGRKEGGRSGVGYLLALSA